MFGSRSAILSVRVVGDATEGVSALRDVENQTSKMDRVLGGVKRAAQVAGVAVTGFLADAVISGFRRSSAIEEASARIQGLGYTAADTADIVNGPVLDSVLGTAFGIDEAAGVASIALAQGIDPAKELQKHLELTGDVAAFAGSEFGEIGSIMNTVSSSNRLYGQQVRQLEDRAVPVISALADHYGVTEAKAREMVSAGKVDFADFAAALEANVGGSAQKAGDTTVGAWRNMRAGVARFGQALISGIFPHFKDGLTGITDILDRMTAAVGPVAEAIGSWLGDALVKVVTWLAALDFSSFEAFTSSAGAAGGIFSQLWDAIMSALPVAQQFLAMLPRILTATVKLVGAGLDILVTVLEFTAENLDWVISIIGIGIGVWLAWRVVVTTTSTAMGIARMAMGHLTVAQTMHQASMAVNNVMYLLFGRRLIATTSAMAGNSAAMAGNTAVTNTQAAATGRATIAQRALNVAMRANVIGAIIVAIGLLVAGFLWLWNNCEGFRDFWIALWERLKASVNAVVSWFTDTALPFLSGVWDGIIAGVNVVVEFFTGTVGPGITGAITTVIGIGQRLLSIYVSIWSSIFGAVSRVVSWLAGGAVALVRGFATGVSRVVQSVLGFFTNLGSGIRSRVDTAVGFVRNIPATIRDLFSGAGDLLSGAGRAIIDGFLGGLTRAWEAGKDFISGIGGWIVNNKGPISYDRKMLRPAGTAIMDGLNTALRAGMKPLRKTVGDVTDELQDMADEPVEVTVNGSAGDVDVTPRGPRKPGPGPEGGGNVYHITIKAGVGDPVAIGREVKKVLETHGHATGTVSTA